MIFPITLKPNHIRVRLDPLLGLVLDLFSSPPPYTEASLPVITLQLSETCSCHLISSLDHILSLPLPTAPFAKLKQLDYLQTRPDESSTPLSRLCSTSLNVERFLALLRESQLDFIYERSIQFKPSSFSDQRHLAGLELRTIAPDLEQKLLNLLRGLEFPNSHFVPLLSRLSAAAWMHFGIEQHGSTLFIKVYLEYPSSFELPCLRHYAIKYSPNTQLAFISEYTHIPVSSRASLTDVFGFSTSQLSQMPTVDSPASSILATLNLFFNEHIPNSILQEIELLEVIDIDTPRASFDINLYSLKLPLGLLAENLFGLAEKLGIDRNLISPVITEHLSSTLGHISYGYHRDSSPFLSVYFTPDFPKNVPL